MQPEMGSWMIGRLDLETRIHHADADAVCDLLFRPDTAAGDYLLYLVRQYGFHAPLESALAMTPGLELLIDLKERFRAGYIAEDLLSLGLRPTELTELPQCMAIPHFTSAATALAWMYVSERATLQHGVLRGHLLTTLPSELPRAQTYLSSYAGLAGSRWRQFGQALDGYARTTAVADEIVEAAHTAFRARAQWMNQDHSTSRATA
jgi:heme oxygenase